MHVISFLMFCYKSITTISDVRLQLLLALCLLLLLHLFSNSSLPALGCQSIFQGRKHLESRGQCHCFNFFVQTFETTSVLALFPITPILQTLPALGPRPPEISTKWFFMAWPHTAMKSIPSGTLIVFTVGNLWESKIKKGKRQESETWLLDLGQTSRDQDQQDQPGVCQRQACVSSSSSRAPPRRPWRGPRAARTWCSPALCGGRSAPCPPSSSSTGQASRGPGRMSREAAKEEMDVPF